MLNEINIAVSTVWREVNYLDTMLDSLTVEHPISAERPISLVVGSPVSGYVERYRSVPGISIIEMGPNTWSWIKNNSLAHRATWNYYRCLTQPTAGTRGTLILEDDIRFARGWRTRLSTTIADLEEHHGPDFVLALYSSHGPAWFSMLGRSTSKQLYADYPPEKFFGTQGMYYTTKSRQGFAKYLKTNGVIAHKTHYDFLLGKYLSHAGLPLFATVPSIIQHIGESSAIENPWHDSPEFVEDVTLSSFAQIR